MLDLVAEMGWVGWCGGMLAYFVYELFRLLAKKRHLSDQIQLAVNVLSFKEDPRDNFILNFETIHQNLCNLPIYEHSWKEFKEHLVFPSGDEDGDSEVRNSMLPDLFFSQDIVIGENLDQKHYDAVPGYLTGLGVVGTFLGLIIGLASIDISALNNLAEFKKGVAGLLGGAQTAFYTSVCGIILSILFSILEKRWITSIERLATQFIDKLEKCLKLNTQVQQQEDIKNIIKDIRNNGEGFINDFISKFEDVFSKLQDHLVTKMNSGSENIVAALESMKSIQSNNQSSFFDNISKQLSGGLENTAHQVQTKAMENFQTLQESFQASNEEMVKFQSSSQKSNQEMLENLAQTTSSIIGNMRQETGTLIENLARESQKSYANISENMSENMQKFWNATNEKSEHLQNVLDGSVQQFSNTFEQINKQLASHYSMFSEMIEKSIQSYHSSSDNISASSQTFKSSMEGLQDNLAVMQNTVSEQMSVAETNKSNIHAFTAILQSLEEFVDSMKNQNLKIESLTTTLSEERAVLQSSTTALVSQWQDYRDRFSEVDESLKEAFQIIRAGNMDFVSQYNDLTEKTIKSVSQISNSLSDAIMELEDVLSTITPNR